MGEIKNILLYIFRPDIYFKIIHLNILNYISVFLNLCAYSFLLGEKIFIEKV